MLVARKPFALKYKLLYQTKINIWGFNESSLSNRFKKKKWNFLRFNNRQKKNLPTFKFSPFARDFSKRFNRFYFKNNLYFRKIIRFKYGRLRNKDLYKLFLKNKGYKEFISKLGSRLDVFLYRIFNRNKSVFGLRQILLHKGVLVNGRRVRSPGYSLKKFDKISIEFKEFTGYFYLQQVPKDLPVYVYYMFFFSAKHIALESLGDKGRDLFLKDFSKLVCPRHYDATLRFVKRLEERYLMRLKILEESPQKQTPLLKQVFLNNKYSKNTKIKKFIHALKNRYLLDQSFYEFTFLKNSFINEDILNVFSKENNLGFFNIKSMGLENFEFNFSKDRLDIVFLGVSDTDKKILSNDKYLLHYLYY